MCRLREAIEHCMIQPKPERLPQSRRSGFLSGVWQEDMIFPVKSREAKLEPFFMCLHFVAGQMRFEFPMAAQPEKILTGGFDGEGILFPVIICHGVNRPSLRSGSEWSNCILPEVPGGYKTVYRTCPRKLKKTDTLKRECPSSSQKKKSACGFPFLEHRNSIDA